MNMKLGCIADDFTGATDLTNNLVRAGMRVVQTMGLPDGTLQTEADAVVIALKTRTIAPAQAIEQSLQALRWLRDQGAIQIYFKYCSTFDSWYQGDVRGNIGPVTEALMAELGTDFTIATPAFPDNGRTVFKGHLFVGDALLSDSGMKDHPLTPMRDANLVRVMQAQCQSRVGLIDHRAVGTSSQAVRQQIEQLKSQGVRIAIVDAVSNDDLLRLGPAMADLPLVTAGSGVAIGLPANFGLQPHVRTSQLPAPRGRRAIVSGSCSQATLGQVQRFIAQGLPHWALDPSRLADETGLADAVDQALAWARSHPEQAVLIYSSAEPAAVRAIQQNMGVEAAGQRVEQALAAISCGLLAQGVRQLVVAGGETSGSCVQALGITQMQIGPQIDPGVPWCHAQSPLSPEGLHITLKSGNFGGVDFFTQSFQRLIP
ncbi:MAG: four-carbon acid sugar kinase family protein [Alphaproteobacteria bacterium]|nr:four-carbon acid sugar kinase family protein [Alphaproteobacteria bacterium]